MIWIALWIAFFLPVYELSLALCSIILLQLSMALAKTYAQASSSWWQMLLLFLISNYWQRNLVSLLFSPMDKSFLMKFRLPSGMDKCNSLKVSVGLHQREESCSQNDWELSSSWASCLCFMGSIRFCCCCFMQQKEWKELMCPSLSLSPHGMSTTMAFCASMWEFYQIIVVVLRLTHGINLCNWNNLTNSCCRQVDIL